MKKKKIEISISILIILLILIDQYIKIYISNNLMNENFYFFNGIIGFKPHINTDLSWLNSLGNFGVGLLPHLIANLIIIFISIIIYDFIRQKHGQDIVINLMAAFLFAGSICSLIDKIFWGGSLDYIHLKGFFIFDLKDVYISIFEILLILCIILNYKGLLKTNDKLIYYELKSFVKVKYLKKHNKN